jgi:hypothetical protein
MTELHKNGVYLINGKPVVAESAQNVDAPRMPVRRQWPIRF